MMRRIILIFAGTQGGLLAAILVAYAWRQLASELTPWGVVAIVTLAGLGLWSKALFCPAHTAHRSIPLHKYIVPSAYSFLGAIVGGLLGFILGQLSASILMAISEFRMRDFMYLRTQGSAGEPGVITFYCLVARFSASLIVVFILWKQFGLHWVTDESTRFIDLLSSPTASCMPIFAGLGALFGFLYELSEHIAGAIYRMR